MSGILDEVSMKFSLERYLPKGETLLAGVHGVGMKTSIKQAFSKCAVVENMLIPKEQGSTIQVSKSKASRYDIYIGISEQYLVLTECETCKYTYEFNDIPCTGAADAQEITSPIPLEDIGKCFPLAEIQSSAVKKAWMGSVNCLVTLQNGTLLKFMLPKLGGLGGDMPHHAQFRNMIIARLNGGNAKRN